MTDITARQIELARHALGLHRAMVSFRNAFVVAPSHEDFVEWDRMAAAGFAIKGAPWIEIDGDYVFHLTRAGAERALMPGDVLDPEDWP